MAVNYRILVINMYTYRLQSRTTHEVLIGERIHRHPNPHTLKI